MRKFISRTIEPVLIKLSTKHLWVKGAQVLAHLSWRLKWVYLITICLFFVIVVIVVNFSHFLLLFKNHYANFNQTWHKGSLVEGDSSLFKWRTMLFQGEIMKKILKIDLRNLKIPFSRTSRPISTKLDTKHPLVKGIQLSEIEGLHLFSRGENNEIGKIH